MRRRLKSPASRLFTQPFIQAQIKENITDPRHWPLCAGNSPVTGEFPAQRASNTENVLIWWRHHERHCKYKKYGVDLPYEHSVYRVCQEYKVRVRQISRTTFTDESICGFQSSLPGLPRYWHHKQDMPMRILINFEVRRPLLKTNNDPIL